MPEPGACGIDQFTLDGNVSATVCRQLANALPLHSGHGERRIIRL